MPKGLTAPFWLAWLLIATIIAFGAYLRVSGIESNLPFFYNPDEPKFIDKAVALLSHYSLDPRWYGHPGQFTIYLLALSYEALFFVSEVTGTTRGFPSFLAWYRYDPTEFYFIGRLLSASFAFGVLILVALIAPRLGSRWPTTALAVLLVSISPVLIAFGYLVRPDNQMTFFALIVCLFAIKITEEPRLAYYVYAGLALGVAVSCKYPAVIFAIAIIAAHTMVQQGRFWRRWYDVALSGAATMVATFLTAPYLFLNLDGMLKDVLGEARPYHLGHTASGPLDSTLWYFDHVLHPSAGYAGVILFLIAMAASALTLAKGRGVLAITAIAFFLFIVNLNLHWTRWLIPFMPLYLTLAALGVQDIACQVARASGRIPVVVAAGVALCIGLLAAPLAALQGEWTDRGEDARTTVFNWIVANVRENSGILLERGGPQLPGEKYKLWAVADEGALAPLVSNRRFVPPKGVVGKLADLSEIEVKDINFIVLSGWYDRYEKEHERYSDELTRYGELMRKYPLILQIGGLKVLRVE